MGLLGTVESRAEVPSLRDQMPDDLRWSRCAKNRNKVTEDVKCLNHPETTPRLPGPWKHSLARNGFPVWKRLGATRVRIRGLQRAG